jgi:hypothetical protein
MRLTAVALGAYASVLGMVHGAFAMQRQTVVSGLLFHAIGPPCDPSSWWHACLPAMTVAPNTNISGVLSGLTGAGMLLWTIWHLRRLQGGGLFLAFTGMLLLAGGGFVLAFVGIVAGIMTITPISKKLPEAGLRAAAPLWPWTLIIFITWAVGGWMLGYYLNQHFLKFSGLLFILFDIGLPIMVALSAYAVDQLSGKNIGD